MALGQGSIGLNNNMYLNPFRTFSTHSDQTIETINVPPKWETLLYQIPKYLQATIKLRRPSLNKVRYCFEKPPNNGITVHPFFIIPTIFLKINRWRGNNENSIVLIDLTKTRAMKEMVVVQGPLYWMRQLFAETKRSAHKCATQYFLRRLPTSLQG